MAASKGCELTRTVSEVSDLSAGCRLPPSLATASRLRRLGWLLTLGGLAVSIIQSSARIVIFTRLVRSPGLGWFEPGQISFSFTTFMIGLTLITVARVMSLGVKMREELDVTV